MGDRPTAITYEYETAPGSSRLIRYSSMPVNKYLRYDLLGNLVSDSARDILSVSWNYRNLMTQTKMTSISTGLYNYVDCSYDESENRLMKKFRWHYWAPCDSFPPPIELMAGGGEDSTLLSGSSMFFDSSGGGASASSSDQYCPMFAQAYTYYLYDNGNLIATFDGDGNVINMYVLSPGGGPVAVYNLNSSTNLHYFMNDHVSSTRVTMKGNSPYSVSSYYTYYPFGQTLESWQSYSSPLQFTGHEHDVNASFDYYNFGARLYDQRVGMFITPDAEGQFASGYVYGNNPVMYIDKDGNIVWFIPVLIGAAVNVAANWDNIDNLGDALGFAGVGAVQGALSLVPGGGAVLGGMFAGAANAGLSGGGLQEMIQGAAIGGIAGGAGSVGGKLASDKIGSVIINSTGVVSPVAKGAIGGAISGAAGGYVGGFTAGMILTGGDASKAHDMGMNGMYSGAAIGTVAGATVAYAQAKSQNIDPWKGLPKGEKFVIGRDMNKRVNPAGEDLGAETYNPPKEWSNEQRFLGNENIIIDKMERGTVMLDIGNGPYPPGQSNNYNMELFRTSNYYNVQKVYMWRSMNGNVRYYYINPK